MVSKGLALSLALAMAFVSGTAGAFDGVADGDERLFMTAPKGWQKVLDNRQGNIRQVEFIPPGQSAKNWSDIVTLTVTYGLRTESLAMYLAGHVSVTRRTCPSARVLQPRFESENGFGGVIYGFECIGGTRPSFAPNVSVKRIELMTFKVIQGRKNLYVAQRAWHGDEKPASYPLASKGGMRPWVAFFDDVELCDTASKSQTCAHLGVFPNRKAEEIVKLGKISPSRKCRHLYQLSVVPDLSKPLGPRAVQTVAVGPDQLGLAGNTRKTTETMLEYILNNAEPNGRVSILMGPSADGLKGSIEKNLDHVARNAEIVKVLLIVKGIDENRIRVRENPDCRK